MPEKDPKHVHRELKRSSKGPDGKEFQKHLNIKADHWAFKWIDLKLDGEVGPRTEDAAVQILHAMGFFGKGMKKARKGHFSEYAQRLIRGTRKRNPAMVALSLKRRRAVKKWRKNYRESQDKKPPKVIHEMVKEVNYLIGKGMSYSWGGGHGTPANSGPGDCSWFASRLWQMIAQIATGTTYTLANEGDSGNGKYFTLYIKNIPGQADESHVICRIFDGKQTRWCECGGRDNTRPGNGPCWFTPTASRIAEFNIQRHPKGY